MKEKEEKLLIIIIALAALALFIGFAIGIYNIGEEIVNKSGWLIAFQIVFIAALVIGLFLAFRHFSMSMKTFIVKKNSELHNHYQVEIKRLKKTQPKILIATALITETILIIADKSFPGDNSITVIVSIFLLIILSIGVHLISGDGKFNKVIGGIIYLFGVVFLPISSMIYQQLTFNQMVENFMAYRFEIKLSFTICFILILISPLTLLKTDREE